MSQIVPFQLRQILCLECQSSKLYAEVIQVVPDRPVCWLRPLILETPPPEIIKAQDTTSSNRSEEPKNTRNSQETQDPQPQPELKTYDLRLSSDLLIPPALFRPALDTEVIPLLSQINATEFNLEEAQAAHYLLRDFIRQVWQDYREFFPQ
jgi:hypothetical protein